MSNRTDVLGPCERWSKPLDLSDVERALANAELDLDGAHRVPDSLIEVMVLAERLLHILTEHRGR